MARNGSGKKKPNEKIDIHEFLRQMALGKKVTKEEFDVWEKEYKKWSEEQTRIIQERLNKAKIQLENAEKQAKEIEEMRKHEQWKKLVKKPKTRLAFHCDTAGFKIGNPIIAITDHSEGTFKTGDVFLLRGLKMGCHCTPLLLDIGLRGFITACDNCRVDTFGGPWMGAHRFEPLDTTSGYTVESLLNELTK